jgi:hypothetical protein
MLQQPVQGVEPMGLPSAAAADGLAHGTQLTTLGYGFTQGRQPTRHALGFLQFLRQFAP